MNDYIIKCENLGFTYTENTEDELPTGDEIPTLKNVTLGIKRGEYVAILGHNGSGKSTFAKLLNMILTPTVGKIYIDGVDITAEDFSEDDVFAIRRKIGMVFQNPDNQTVATIVEDDIAFGPENLGVPREEIGERIASALSAVDMQAFRHATVSRLSGGQKQRVAIAGVLALAPDLLILDESTAMLDPVGRREVLATAKRLNKEKNITVVLITHFMEEAAEADTVIVMDGGKAVLQGAPKEVFIQRETLRALGIDLPRPMLLAEELRKQGVPVSQTVMTKEELAEELCRLAQKD